MNALKDLDLLIRRQTSDTEYPHASHIEHNIPIYRCADLGRELESPDHAAALRDELANVLLDGPGVFVLSGAYADTQAVDAATAVFMSIIKQEKTQRQHGGDHFAEAGANDRIWNSLEKLCLKAPAVFAKYHGNPWLRLASEAWLGPCYQMTAQVNLVHPGGKSQSAHCDYHLGFMTRPQVGQFPDHAQEMSSRLTLQGAVAHCDMPIDSGPTRLLPFSHRWSNNYRLFREPDVQDRFNRHSVQIRLQKGDAIFFSPALLHAAGENRTSNVQRLANLLQVSSPLGRAMETVNRTAMCKALYAHLVDARRNAQLSDAEVDAAIASAAEGYPFPTNLDTDPPLDGNAPASQQDLFRTAIAENWTQQAFFDALDERDRQRV